jgi:hypothetical protein
VEHVDFNVQLLSTDVNRNLGETLEQGKRERQTTSFILLNRDLNEDKSATILAASASICYPGNDLVTSGTHCGTGSGTSIVIPSSRIRNVRHSTSFQTIAHCFGFIRSINTAKLVIWVYW